MEPWHASATCRLVSGVGLRSALAVARACAVVVSPRTASADCATIGCLFKRRRTATCLISQSRVKRHPQDSHSTVCRESVQVEASDLIGPRLRKVHQLVESEIDSRWVDDARWEEKRNGIETDAHILSTSALCRDRQQQARFDESRRQASVAQALVRPCQRYSICILCRLPAKRGHFSGS